MTPSLSLETVESRFATWRENRKHLREPVPTILRKQALELKSTYSTSQVTAALKISGSMLKRWEAMHTTTRQPDSSNFLSLPALAPEIPQGEGLLTIHFPNGVNLSLKEKALDNHLLSSLFQLKVRDEQ
jgi:hypothetical protein